MKNWKTIVGWVLMTLFVLGSATDHPDAAAIIFLAGAVIYWGARIEAAILSK